MAITLEQIDDTPTRRPEPKRDRWNRYVIDGSSWQRVTTLAKVLDDQSSLADWKARMAALGLAKRPDLFAQVATCNIDDRKTLNALVEQAKEAAGASVKANLGTALHAMCEQVDLGLMSIDDVPEQWRADVAAYRNATEGMAWTHVEAILLNRTVQVAGTTDRLSHRVADIKTGSLDYAALAIAVQLACYANSDAVYDPSSDTLQPMPAVDKTTGLVIHLPVGEGTCSLYEVDLVAGWRYAQLAAEVRDARKAGAKKGELIRPATAARQAAVTQRRSAPVQRIVPVGSIDAGVELNGGEGPWATAEEVDAARNEIRALKTKHPAAYDTITALYAAANTAHPDVAGIALTRPSFRRVCIARGLVALARTWGDELDDLVLRCISAVIPDAAMPSVALHDAYVALKPREAEAFLAVARAVADGKGVCSGTNGSVVWTLDPTDLAASPAA